MWAGRQSILDQGTAAAVMQWHMFNEKGSLPHLCFDEHYLKT